ncbi:Ger(x)C family spore germination protein [Paenibacillus antri]|uniref:Ger(X)C family spore germination protein n=1 Tax=Paenibacillus antri TaxID=2582848 RepID=A0A5R9G5N0_9BACL|nr:Ger(x)C family spore germination protein [Paenibacillus antri]TLS48808.1 Ger(x)C family spore germination protein [Paenibacillus antri]
MRKLVVILLSFTLLLLPGCGFKDIDKRFFVVAIGVDKGMEKKYKVTFKLAIPSPQIKPGQGDFQLVSREANNISEAIELMKSDVDKEFDMGHAKIAVLGKELASEEITEAVDWFIRSHDIQRIEYAALGEPSAEEILALGPKSERLAANSLILSFGREGTESSFIVTEYLYDFYDRLLETGKDPFLPIIKIRGDTYEINRVALFDKEKLKMILNAEQTRIFNQLVSKHSRFGIRVDEEDVHFSLSVQKYDYSYKISTPSNEKPSINMVVTIKGQVAESDRMLFGRNWEELEESAERAVQKSYLNLLEKIKKNNVDPVGFGLKYIATRRNGLKDWEQWQKIYPDAQFNIRVNVILENTGEIK